MKKRSALFSRIWIALGANPRRKHDQIETVESLRKRLNLPANHNPSLEQMREAGLNATRPAAPAGPHSVVGELHFAGFGLGIKPRLQTCDSTGRCYDEDQIAAVMDILNKNSQPKRYIELTPAEIQSGLDRVRFAELLIRQLPEDHGGRNTWLLNYGRKQHDGQ